MVLDGVGSVDMWMCILERGCHCVRVVLDFAGGSLVARWDDTGDMGLT